MGKDSRSSGYNLGINDVVLERVIENGNRRDQAFVIAPDPNRPPEPRFIEALVYRVTSANTGHPNRLVRHYCEPSALSAATPPRPSTMWCKHLETPIRKCGWQPPGRFANGTKCATRRFSTGSFSSGP